MNFSRLIKLNIEIPEDFFGHFPRIQELTAKGLVDREKFKRFLVNATVLRTLTPNDTLLIQAFVDILPELCSRLTCLKVSHLSLVTDFQFLLRFELLERFETDRLPNSFDLAAAFRQMAKLQRILLRSGRTLVEFQRSSDLADGYSLRLL